MKHLLVMCVDNKDVEDQLTLNKIYLMISFEHDEDGDVFFTIVNPDNGSMYGNYLHHRFTIAGAK